MWADSLTSPDSSSVAPGWAPVYGDRSRERKSLAMICSPGREAHLDCHNAGQRIGNPIVHFETRSEDPSAGRESYGDLIGWKFIAAPPEHVESYAYIDSQADRATIHGGMSNTQGGSRWCRLRRSRRHRSIAGQSRWPGRDGGARTDRRPRRHDLSPCRPARQHRRHCPTAEPTRIGRLSDLVIVERPQTAIECECQVAGSDSGVVVPK